MERHSLEVSEKEVSRAETPEIQDEDERKEKIKKYSLLAFLVCFLIFVVVDYTVPGMGFIQDILISFLKWFLSLS